jgi:hypothetical protein
MVWPSTLCREQWPQYRWRLPTRRGYDSKPSHHSQRTIILLPEYTLISPQPVRCRPYQPTIAKVSCSKLFLSHNAIIAFLVPRDVRDSAFHAVEYDTSQTLSLHGEPQLYFFAVLFTIETSEEESVFKSNFSLHIHIRNYKHKFLINQLTHQSGGVLQKLTVFYFLINASHCVLFK